MAQVFRRMLQQHLVQLPDVIFRQVDIRPGVENEVHGIGLAGNFLFVA